MIEYQCRWNGERYVRVPKPADRRRVVELEAGQVRGSNRPVYTVVRRPGRAVALQDHHAPASGSGRTVPKRRT